MATKIRVTKVVPPSEGDKPVDNKLRQDWNDFLMYLEKRGVRGKPDLDKGGKGYQLFDEYVKATPETSLSREALPVIRKELLNYRNWVLEQNKSGANKLAEGVNEGNFMRHVLENEKSTDPNLPGQHLTVTPFPQSYLTTFNNNKNMGTINQGLTAIKSK